MIKYIETKTPKIDEKKLHFNVIKNLMSRYNKIVLLFPPDSYLGEYDIWLTLFNKYSDTKWNFYVDQTAKLKAPFVFYTNDIEFAPVADAYYVINYSVDYKESITGISFDDDFPRPMHEYKRVRAWFDFNKIVGKQGKVYKSKTELRKLLK